jgi:antitoxin (DNA-binding transcriptional repressor) of toxin-antitoxin stability system
MRKVQLDQARDALEELLATAASGEDVLIERGDGLSARLTSLLPDMEPQKKTNLRDIQPISVGAILKPLSSEDDLLDEMLQR